MNGWVSIFLINAIASYFNIVPIISDAICSSTSKNSQTIMMNKNMKNINSHTKATARICHKIAFPMLTLYTDLFSMLLYWIICCGKSSFHSVYDWKNADWNHCWDIAFILLFFSELRDASIYLFSNQSYSCSCYFILSPIDLSDDIWLICFFEMKILY